MNQRVTLQHQGEVEEVVVSRVETFEDSVHLMGADPYAYPESFRSEIIFFSKDSTAVIQDEKSVSVLKIEPTEDDVWEPDVRF